MKTKLLLFCPAFVGIIYAQAPILDPSAFFQVGDSALIYQKTDTSLASFTPGAAGTNITWDFSAMDFNHPSVIVDTLSYIDPAGTPFYTDTMVNYSLANLCLLRKTIPFSPNNKDYSYYISTNDSIAFIGHWANNGGSELWEDHCDDLIREISFPFTYLDGFTDSYVRTYLDMSGSDYHFITGTNRVKADAYGSLITPDGITIPDVMRIHTVETARDSNFLFGIEYRTRHMYRWYASGKKGFILSLNMSYVDSASIESAEYQKQTNYNTGVVLVQGSSILSVYPNPVHETMMVQLPGKLISSLRIHDLSGHTVVNVQSLCQSSYMLQCSGLSCGVYIVEVTSSANEVIRKKFIVD